MAIRAGKQDEGEPVGPGAESEWQTGVDARDRVRLSAAAISAGGEIRADNEVGAGIWILREREEHGWTRIFGQHLVLAVFDNADDLVFGLVAAEEVTADCGLVAEHFAGEGAVHDWRREAFWGHHPR